MTVLIVATPEDTPYASALKRLFPGTALAYTAARDISTVSEVISICKKRGISQVLSTHPKLLEKFILTKPSISNYAGSLFKRDDVEFVFCNPLRQIFSVSYGAFMLKRFMSKFTNKSAWRKASEFNWSLATPANSDEVYSRFEDAYLLAVDIETLKNPPAIRCVGYTAVYHDGTTESYVIPLTDEFFLALVRKFNSLPAAKIFQNGKYDIAYLARFNCIPDNYLWDTAYLFHAWYSELPKDLGFLQAFFVRDAHYWKDLADSGDTMEYYRYNALDTWATAEVFLAIMTEIPEWAKANYAHKFLQVFPNHLCEMSGLLVDTERQAEVKKELSEEIAEEEAALSRMLGVGYFNVGSPKQVLQLLHILGCKDIKSSNAKDLEKAASRHPLNRFLIDRILHIRSRRKLVSTYFVENKLFNGRFLYALNGSGTDTARANSGEHAFWCGQNIQNIPRGKIVKQYIVADEGFYFAEADFAQAESRDTAYISGDPALIEAVEGERDFHCVNAAAFFGIPYEELYDDGNKIALNKRIRDLAKRVNHGANYVMGPNVLVDTMSEAKVYEAGRMLGLSKLWSAVRIAEYLLEQFHKAYPNISAVYYSGAVASVAASKMLSVDTSWDVPYQPANAKQWTRYCFGNPQKNKRDLNVYAAHGPQNLNAMTLDKAFFRVFMELALDPKYSNNFRLCAQIHDSIFFQYRIGHEYLCDLVQEKMELPCTIKAYDGQTRTFTVPADVKAGKGARRWSETE